ncbi:MAG: hypothetical protein GX620_01890, partial [Chloroflexi bacterium]|nr:hypothetical protein [Chloroflexota bacterium]
MQVRDGDTDELEALGMTVVLAAFVNSVDESLADFAPVPEIETCWEEMLSVHEHSKDVLVRWFNSDIDSSEVIAEMEPLLADAERALVDAERTLADEYGLPSKDLTTARQDLVQELRDTISGVVTPEPSDQATATDESAPSPSAGADGAVAAFGDGTWRVGADIEPGTYRADSASGCYWERISDFGGGIDSIIANGNPRGPAVITIAPTDAGFVSQRCGSWVLADNVKPDAPSVQISDGTWRIGTDIAPGTYRT